MTAKNGLGLFSTTSFGILMGYVMKYEADGLPLDWARLTEGHGGVRQAFLHLRL